MARYTELENKHIHLDLDLKPVQENFQKAKDEAKGMFGENLDDCPCFLHVSKSDLIVIFAEKRKDALKKKDLDLAEAQKAASDKRSSQKKSWLQSANLKRRIPI